MPTVNNTAPIIRRPSWADQSRFVHDTETVVGVTHLWGAPTVAECVDPGGDGSGSVTTHLIQRDDLTVEVEGIVVKPGRVTVWIPELDVEFPSVKEARQFAAAVLQCCDRLDASAGAR